MTNILYVEDDVSSQRLVERILTAEGFNIAIADNGISAIEVARRGQPDRKLRSRQTGALLKVSHESINTIRTDENIGAFVTKPLYRVRYV